MATPNKLPPRAHACRSANTRRHFQLPIRRRRQKQVPGAPDAQGGSEGFGGDKPSAGLDMQSCRLVKDGKGGKNWVLWISEDLRDLVEEWKARRPDLAESARFVQHSPSSQRTNKYPAVLCALGDRCGEFAVRAG